VPHAETTRLTELLNEQQRLEARVDAVGAEERAAATAAHEASDQLIALERAAASGAKVSQARRHEAENSLLQARSTAAAPWGERRRAAQLAVEDARQAVAAHVGANLDALLADLELEGRQAADAVDAAAQAVLDAHGQRADVEARTIRLLALTGHRMQPGDVQRGHSDELAGQAERLLLQGGEAPPSVRHRPGEPRHGAMAAVPAA
jgi:hypothetical protein